MDGELSNDIYFSDVIIKPLSDDGLRVSFQSLLAEERGRLVEDAKG